MAPMKSCTFVSLAPMVGGAIGAGGFAKLYHTITIANQSSCGWCLTVQYKCGWKSCAYVHAGAILVIVRVGVKVLGSVGVRVRTIHVRAAGCIIEPDNLTDANGTIGVFWNTVKQRIPT